jgi:STE24 endopeptidase
VKTEEKASVISIVAESAPGGESGESESAARESTGRWANHGLGHIAGYRVGRLLSAACLAVLLFGSAARDVGGQAAPAPSGAAPAVSTQQGATEAQAYTLPPEKREKAIELSRIRNTLDITESVVWLVLIWLFLASRAAAFLECRAIHLSRHRWVQGLAFFAALFVLSMLAALPFDLIGHHYSRAFGISVQSWGGWSLDLGKALGLEILFGAPILLLFSWIVKRWPKRYWLGIWLVTVPLLVLSAFSSPFLEPIFDKFEPLQKEHAGLVADLEKLVARTGTQIPPERMFLMKASEKTNGLNAYVSGMGATKRIVVWDTTAGRIPNDEVLFIFGHESGHYVLHHLPKGMAVAAILSFFIYWGCAGLAGWMARRSRGRWLRRGDETDPNPLATRAGFVILLFAISIASFVTSPLTNAVSRHFEHEADVYGQEAIHGLVPDPQKTAVASFNALGEAWLEDPDPSPLIEFWLYDHPSVKNRAEFAAHYDPWANGGRGKFFAR